MTAKQELLKQLSEQKVFDAAKGPAMIAEWRESLTQLFRKFAEWLAEPVAEDLLAVVEVPVRVQEERLGDYDAPSLKITTPRGETIRIAPKARLVLGADGRVDFVCGPKTAVLIRKDRTRWQFAELAPDRGGWSFEDLTDTSFWKKLQYLLS